MDDSIPSKCKEYFKEYAYEDNDIAKRAIKVTNQFLKKAGIKDFCKLCHACCPENSKPSKYCDNLFCRTYICDFIKEIARKEGNHSFSFGIYLISRLRYFMSFLGTKYEKKLKAYVDIFEAFLNADELQKSEILLRILQYLEFLQKTVDNNVLLSHSQIFLDAIKGRFGIKFPVRIFENIIKSLSNRENG